jgi:mannose-6-phosphate isomerase
MDRLYPLRFHPLWKRHLWGGRRLATVLGKSLGPGDDYAESWEVVDRGSDQSVVAAGPLAGATLGEIVGRYGRELFGQRPAPARFPLLVKFLDAQRPLSVQVHPNDEQAAQLDPPDLGKTEAWVIVHAEPGSYLYAGLRAGVDRQVLAEALAAGDCEPCLARIEPRAGECYFLPAGTVHALGPGLVVAELQQSSDTTYRLFDWNRLGPDGRPRTLHLAAGLAVVDDRRGPVRAEQPQPTAEAEVERLVQCEYFVLDRRRMSRAAVIGGDERFHLLAVLEGEVALAGDRAERPLGRGEVALVPAGCGEVAARPRGPAVVLEAWAP